MPTRQLCGDELQVSRGLASFTFMLVRAFHIEEVTVILQIGGAGPEWARSLLGLSPLAASNSSTT